MSLDPVHKPRRFFLQMGKHRTSSKTFICGKLVFGEQSSEMVFRMIPRYSDVFEGDNHPMLRQNPRSLYFDLFWSTTRAQGKTSCPIKRVACGIFQHW